MHAAVDDGRAFGIIATPQGDIRQAPDLLVRPDARGKIDDVAGDGDAHGVLDGGMVLGHQQDIGGSWERRQQQQSGMHCLHRSLIMIDGVT